MRARMLVDMTVTVAIEWDTDHTPPSEIENAQPRIDRAMSEFIPHPDDMITTGGPGTERIGVIVTSCDIRTE
jgi:hypothetical protein